MRVKAESLSISDSVIFMGSRTDVNKLMSGMDLFVFPSLNEGLPVSVVEAQASGLKIVTSDTVSSDTVLSDLVVRKSLSDSPQKWAQTMAYLYSDTTKHNRASYADIIRAAGFDAGDVANRLCALYERDSR